jgi:hypothetical protein
VRKSAPSSGESKTGGGNGSYTVITEGICAAKLPAPAKTNSNNSKSGFVYLVRIYFLQPTQPEL